MGQTIQPAHVFCALLLVSTIGAALVIRLTTAILALVAEMRAWRNNCQRCLQAAEESRK